MNEGEEIEILLIFTPFAFMLLGAVGFCSIYLLLLGYKSRFHSQFVAKESSFICVVCVSQVDSCVLLLLLDVLESL